MIAGGSPASPAAVRQQRRVNIRLTHPALYRSIMVLAIGSILLALNFWTSNPTFSPLSIPKDLVGVVFAATGVGQIVYLNVVRDLRWVRRLLGASIFVHLVWGLLNCQQAINGRASWQLPLLYLIIAFLVRPLLTEAPVNPMTEVQK